MGRKPCCSKNGVKKGVWTALEDKILTDYIRVHGEGKWRDIPKLSGLQRCGKSCRLRWLNYLRPDIKRGNISEDEEDLIIRLHRLLGNRWSLIAGRLPGRTDNEIKNYWNTHLAKKPQPSLNLSPPNVSNLPKSALFSSHPVPSSTVRNHGKNLSNSNHLETFSAPLPWSNEDDYQQDFSFLDFGMGDISVSGEYFDNFFSNLDEVHTETEACNRTERLQDSSASLIGSQVAEERVIADWLGSILQ